VEATHIPKLSIVILNHNAGSMLCDCLDSLFADDLPQPFEVIIPDNASTDGSLELARRKWGQRIRILHNGGNRGFSWGNNKGVAVSLGDYVCLLNPDTIVHAGAFRRLVRFMDDHPAAGCVGPKVLNRDGTFQLSAKRSIPSPFDAMSRALHLSRLFPKSRRFARYNVTYLDPDTTQRVDASTGCCMVIRRTALEQVGLFDEGYFIYCEDVDWFLRAKAEGWEVWYVGDAVIEHHHAYSAQFRKRKAVEDFHYSMIRFYRKHYAGRYPAVFNVMIYAAVHTRMRLMTLYRAVRGWG
jgi:N-acetylglucosaminyl-diphospho-decaprenol L-rhamnosyltransferase